MRLDKFLKVSRLIKRRTVANEACDAGRVRVNSKPARASYEVKDGDILEISLGARSLRVRVVSASAAATRENAPGMYEILSGPAGE
ncbi:MAG: RNA-binding S4 domain-containing protein [Oscillospiraceae bacterium]|jgi:ribosomal 50S subunit-recycling heat shock protein|nr:RNA-binding S4 domain-containing protein [Oscillospiraceae bacterium]